MQMKQDQTEGKEYKERFLPGQAKTSLITIKASENGIRFTVQGAGHVVHFVVEACGALRSRGASPVTRQTRSVHTVLRERGKSFTRSARGEARRSPVPPLDQLRAPPARGTLFAPQRARLPSCRLDLVAALEGLVGNRGLKKIVGTVWSCRSTVDDSVLDISLCFGESSFCWRYFFRGRGN